MGTMLEEGIKNSAYLSPLNIEASMPCLQEMNNGDIIATWTNRTQEGNELRFQKFLVQVGQKATRDSEIKSIGSLRFRSTYDF